VPDVIKKSFPAIYCAAEISSVNPHIQVRSSTSCISGSSSGSSQCSSAPENFEMQNSAVSAETDSAKKRRLEGSDSLTGSDGQYGALCVGMEVVSENVVVGVSGDSLTSMIVSEVIAESAAVPLKAKKRIAPTLVSSVSTASVSGSVVAKERDLIVVD
jgi:hypothetical protein